jgi:hypothetical protein
LGFFDTLGNAYEVCHVSDAPIDSPDRAVFCGGSAINVEIDLHCQARRGPTRIDQIMGVVDVGFRVARTVRSNLTPARK